MYLWSEKSVMCVTEISEVGDIKTGCNFLFITIKVKIPANKNTLYFSQSRKNSCDEWKRRKNVFFFKYNLLTLSSFSD